MFYLKEYEKTRKGTMSTEEDKGEALVYKEKLETETIPDYAAHSENATLGLELTTEYNGDPIEEIKAALGDVTGALEELRAKLQDHQLDTEEELARSQESDERLAMIREAIESLFATSENAGAITTIESLTGASQPATNANEALKYAIDTIGNAITVVIQAKKDIETALKRVNAIHPPLEQVIDGFGRSTSNFDETGSYLKAAVGGLEVYINTA